MLEWLHAAQHHVKNDASAPDVNLICIRLTREHLRRAELHNPGIRFHNLRLGIVLPRHVEVNDEKMIITFPNEQVRRLDIPVNNLLAMQILKSFQYLHKKFPGLALAVGCALDVEEVEKLDAVDVLHHLVLLISHLIVKIVVHPDDIFMAQLRQNIILVLLRHLLFDIVEACYFNGEGLLGFAITFLIANVHRRMQAFPNFLTGLIKFPKRSFALLFII